MAGLSEHQLRLARVRAQHLAADAALGDPVAVARAVCGIQAQDMGAAALAVRVRTRRLTAADVAAAVEARQLVRTWLMRGTLHLVAAEDLGWLLALHGPVFAAAGRRRREELGFDDASAERAAQVAHETASGGPVTKAEIEARLAHERLPHAGQATIHAIGLAAHKALVCCGPTRGGKPTYVALEDWVGAAERLPREAGLAELARRYLRGYGPAAFEDFVAWSRLPAGELRRAWHAVGAETREVGSGMRALGDGGFAGTKGGAAGLSARLAGAFDTYLLGYRGRELVVPSEHLTRVNAGGGMIRPVVLVDGLAVGTWSLARRGRKVGPVVEPFGRLSEEVEAGIEAEARDLARFLGV